MIRVGLHIIPDRLDQTALLGMIARLAKAGHPVPFVTVLNDAALADKIKEVSPKTIVVFRADFNDHPQASDDGGAWLNRYLPTLRLCKTADAYQCACEDLSSIPTAMSAFYLSMMKRALQVGIRIVIGNIASGNPPGDVQAGVEALRPMLQFASDHGFPLDYHLYSPRTTAGFSDISALATYYVLRYKFWKAAFPKLIIWGGEAGTGQPDFQGDKTLALMKQLNALIDIPVAYWSCGWWSDDQGASQIDSILNQYEAWLMGGIINPTPLPPADPDAGLRALAALLQGIPDSELFEVKIQRFALPYQEFACPVQRLRQMLTALNLLVPTAPATINYRCTTALHVRSNHKIDPHNTIGSLKQEDIVPVLVGQDFSDGTYNWVARASGGWCAQRELAPGGQVYLIPV